MTDLVLQVNGRNYTGWERINVTLGIEQVSGSFDLTASERHPGRPDALGINLGDQCRVLLGGATVITGYVDDVNPDYDNEFHTVQITGRDRTGDLVDCAALHGSGEWHKASLTRIATDICAPFGVKAIAAVDVGKPFSRFSIWPGETAYDCLERAARMRGVLLMAGGAGNLLLTRAGTGRIGTALVKGRNVERASGAFSHRDRYSLYIVKGQAPGEPSNLDHAGHHLQTRASVRDDAISRYRPHVVIAEPGDGSTYKDRAVWERNVRAGRGSRATCTVTGWEHAAGLWLPNRLVPVRDDYLGIDGDMLIAQVQFGLEEGRGSTAQITVCKPEAFDLVSLPDKSKKKKGESLRW